MMTIKPYVLLVEDEAALLTLLRYNLEAQGFEVDEAVDGEEALVMIKERRPDLVVLDWMLPTVSGIEVCRRVRRSADSRNLPIIMLTARGEEADRIRGLDSGADDYIVKPFSPKELIARIRAVLRRLRPALSSEVLSYDDVTMDLAAHRVTRCGNSIHLGPTEYRLLRHLYGENHVTYVRNITDVDDKINARALRDFPDLPLNEAIRNVTEKTADQFHEDIKALGCVEPDFEPRATEHIDGMIAMIQVLIDKGHAYVVEGGNGLEVLFDVKKMPAYGKLSNRKLDEQMAGARVAVENHKRSPGDFVLWKQSSENEPGWDASFTDGGEADGWLHEIGRAHV